MSCALNGLVTIRNIRGIIEWFQLDGEVQEDKVWDAKWEDWNSSCSEEESKKVENNWLGKCLSCISSMGDVATIAHKNRIAILTANDLVEDEEKRTLCVTWKGTVGEVEGDDITDVMCLPLASQNTSSAGIPDCTCIIIGFKSGHVSVYSENGMLLFSQIFEECPVVNLHCRTFTLGDFGVAPWSDLGTEFVIGYQSCVISIDGGHFLEMLRLCRKRAAQAAAGSLKLVASKPLKYMKYSLEDQQYLSSCVSAGSLIIRVYEKLIHESFSKGFVDMVGGGSEPNGNLLTVGEMPYFGVIEMKDEHASLHLSDIAFGIASHFKNNLISAASDWLFPLKGSSKQEPSPPKIVPASPANFRTFLPDRRRIGTTVALSPSRRLAAVTDSFGRVVVIDVVRGTAVKMWKGYRDAECGWQEVVDEWGGEKRRVTFLIIYAPRRGILEVWLPQQGTRIAAFNVSKQARLLYVHHIVLGFASSIWETYHSYPVLLLNPTGVIQNIQIPFHLALSYKTDRQARDQHILKEIQSSYRKRDEDGILFLVRKLETVYGKLQFVIWLFGTKNYSLSLVDFALQILIEVKDEDECKEKDDISKSTDEPDYSSHESKKLNVCLKRMERLTQFYIKLMVKRPENSVFFTDEDENKMILAKMLVVKLDEIDHLPILSSKAVKGNSSKKIRFEKEVDIAFYPYMNSFDICTDATYDSDIPIHLKKQTVDDVESGLTTLLFRCCERQSFEETLNAIESSGIAILDLVEVIYLEWYAMKDKSITSAKKLCFIVTGLFFLNGDFVIEDDDISDFWFLALKCIHPWTHIPTAHLTAIICRGLDQSCTKFLQDHVKDLTVDRISLWRNFMEYLTSQDYKFISLNEWESTAPHIIEWNIFIGRIKSLSGLYQMLRRQNSDATVSVRSVIDSGSGHISELVAKYITQMEISPNSLQKILEQFNNHDMKDDSLGGISFTAEESSDELDPNLKTAYDDISAVKENFRVSLTNDCVLCNVCWELGALWQKNPNETKYLTLLVDFFQLLEYTVISSGTAILLWDFLLKDRLCRVMELTEKFKRIPSDRMSIEKVGISQQALEVFFRESRRFLDSILDLLIKNETSCSTTSSVKDSFWNYDDRLGFVDRAKKASSELCPNMIHLHMDLIFILYFINEFNLTDIAIHSLFSDEQRRVLFKPLTDCIYDSTFLNPNLCVMEYRIQFLKIIITKGVEQLPENFDESITIIIPNFFTEVVELARIWKCDADIIRRIYVKELLQSGFDKSAQHAIRWLNNVKDLPEDIFIIGGLRVKFLMDTLPGQELAKLITSMSPVIINWIRKLEAGSLRNPKVSMINTKITMESVSPFISPASYHYTAGKYLIEALPGIIREGF